MDTSAGSGQAARFALALEQLRQQVDGLCAEADPPHLRTALTQSLEEAAVAEEELRAQSEALEEAWEQVERERIRYQELFEFAPDAYLVSDGRGVVREANRAARALLRPRGGRLEGMPLPLFVAEPQRAEFRHRLNALPGDGTPEEWSVELASRDGRGRLVEVRAGGAPSRDGGVTGIRWLLRDITERQRMQRRLHRSNEELQRFTSVVAHDLKAPLRAVHGLSGWIEEEAAGQLSEAGRQRMSLLRARVQRMDMLINDLLDYSRAGRAQPPEPIWVAGLVAGTLAELALPEGFTVTVADGLPCLCADRLHLRQVLGNLIANAITHHDRSEGHVHISARDGNGYWELAVADDGPGIAPAYRSRIFEMFQRLDPDKANGTGIGLALVKKVVEEAGGRVWVEPSPGRGATFRFTWPKVPEGAPA